MQQEQRLVVVGRADLHEEYVAQLISDSSHGHAGCVNSACQRQADGDQSAGLTPETRALLPCWARGVSPIVRILFILKYPQQHAIYWPEVAIEIAPIRAGCVCRLPFLRDATQEEAGRYASWEQSAAELQRDYLTRCENAAEREIIARQMAGEYQRRRMVREYTESELRATLRAWEEVQRD